VAGENLAVDRLKATLSIAYFGPITTTPSARQKPRSIEPRIQASTESLLPLPAMPVVRAGLGGDARQLDVDGPAPAAHT
jgi:hypothetical protein